MTTPDEKRFANLLSRAMEVLGCKDNELSHELGVSRTTVLRWRRGTVVPFTLMRKPVYNALAKRLRKKISV